MPNQDNKPRMSALDKLRSARQISRNAEKQANDAMRAELEDTVHTVEPAASPFLEALKKLTKKQLIIGGVVAVGLPILISAGIYIRTALIPSQLLSTYEEATADGDYAVANEAIESYLEIKSDDWERMAEYGYSLIKQGNFEKARNTYATLISKSPLASDLDIQFLSAMSYLPRLNSTKSKMTEVLVLSEDYLPALVARALLSENLEEAAEDLDQAVSEYQQLRRNGDIYQRYQDLIATFVVNLCRTDDPFKVAVSPEFAFYPDLRGDDLLLYGIDSNFSLDICLVTPNNLIGQNANTQDLGVMIHALNAYIAIQGKDYESAIQSVAQSSAIQVTPINSYIEALLLAFTGDYLESDTSFLRTGLETTTDVIVSRSIVKMLRGPDYWEDAAELLDSALIADPQNSQALNNRAVYSMLNGRYGQASNDLEDALAATSFYSHAVYNLAIVLLFNGEPEQALNRFNTLSSAVQRFPGIRYYVALANANLGDEEKAIVLWQNSVDAPGYGPLSNLALGDVFADDPIGRSTALNFYQASLDQDSGNFEAALKLARMAALLGDSERALNDIAALEGRMDTEQHHNIEYFKELAAAIKGEVLYLSDDPAATEALKTAYENTEDFSLYRSVVRLYTKQLLKLDQVRDALDVTRAALPTDPSDLTLLLARAEALAAFNDIPEALEIIEDAEKLYAEDLELLSVKAWVLSKDQRWDEAVDIYIKVFERRPSDLEPIETSIALLERVDPTSPKLVELRDMISRASYEPGQDVQLAAAQAAKVITDPAEIDKIVLEIEETTQLLEEGTVEKFSGLRYRGYLNAQVGNIDESITDYQQAIQHIDEDPESAYLVWQALANSFILKDRFTDAVAALDTALALDPPIDQTPSLYLTRGGVKERIGLVKEAIEDYNRVSDTFPNYTVPYLRRGFLYLSTSEPELAIKELSIVISIEPENLQAYKARHRAFTLIGDNDNATKDAKSITLLETELISQ